MEKITRILGIIPARFASSRLPGKPLLKIGGKTMIELVYQQAKKCQQLLDVIVATDDSRIFDHVNKFGGISIMTNTIHTSGTDRCYEALEISGKNYDYVINIQGDEPFIQPEQIDILANLLDGETEIATLVKKIEDNLTLFNENTPKVILNKNEEAIYFSRQTIPFLRDSEKDNWLANNTFFKHIGIYAYRTDILKTITSLTPTTLELAESLEQLRWIENGYKIKVAVSPYDTIGIDTPEDLAMANLKIISNK
jgi:3-deoxy-manno-octulosonate cytidylyltransferase (CMP-KDO synthetase)